MFKTKRLIIALGLILLLTPITEAGLFDQTDVTLLKEAKRFLFDKEWKKAQAKLEELLIVYPESSLYSQAIFFKARCLEEQKGMEKEALNEYQRYLIRRDRHKNLVEEAEIAIIDLAFRLYEKGQRDFLEEITVRLSSSDKVVKYYAAFKLSGSRNKKDAAKAVPVLKDIVKEEKDLRDRAKIALLRIDPKAYRDIEDETYERRGKMLNIRVFDKRTNKKTLSLNIPWALADLALSAIPEEEKAKLRREGYDLDSLIEELTRIGNIIEIEDEDSVIKIWID